jgi:hypothetical protein
MRRPVRLRGAASGVALSVPKYSAIRLTHPARTIS